ncbi:MAG: DUF3332 domain-containing protein [bacterium]|nr:DUF3332 domain-containing protein [bacterium]
MKKLISLVLVICLFSFVLSGCYGSFQVTRKLWKWNGTVGDKWLNEVVFLVMNIVPVYGVAAFVDAIVVNSIEFWTGKNPVTAANSKTIKVVSVEDKQAVLAFYGNGRMKMDLFDKTQPLKTVLIEKSADGSAVCTDGHGQLLMTAKTMPNGQVIVMDSSSREIAKY